MKSQVNALLHVVQGLCNDVLAAYPALKGVNLDYERIALYCRTRGLNVFTLDLPNLDSLLLQGLEEGRLRLSGPLSRRVSGSVRVPRLFAGLWLRVFDRDASLKQDVDVNAIMFLRQLCAVGKKIAVECSPERIQLTLENYHGIERALRYPSLGWDSDKLYVEGNTAGDLHLGDCVAVRSESDLFAKSEEESKKNEGLRRLLDQVQQVADLVLSSWDIFDPVTLSGEWEENGLGIGFKHGPGAVAERLSQGEKSSFPNWPAKLEYVFPWEFCGKSAGSDEIRPALHEPPSRLKCVPKTAKGPRLIASEPTSHMWCQQMIRQFMVLQLRKKFGTSFIDFHDQSKSGDLVLQASLDRKLATVDLSDASDRLSCWTVERVFRSNPSLLSALHAARTRYIRYNISDVQGFLKPKKFASQGTATTFPVQSIVFLCIALGVCLDGTITMRKIRNLRNQVRVFGDDIIIPSHGYARLLNVMDALQLKVNIAKSYVNGHFRESCGQDGYMGYDVTPVKPKTLVADSPASALAVVDSSNNLFNKGYWNASDSLKPQIPPRVQRGLRIVGLNDAGFAGLTSFSGSDERHLVSRWNPRLHRYEVRVWSLRDRTQKRDRQGFSVLLDFFASKHNHEHARIVSTDRGPQKTRDGFLWEPHNPGARVYDK